MIFQIAFVPNHVNWCSLYVSVGLESQGWSWKWTSELSQLKLRSAGTSCS